MQSNNTWRVAGVLFVLAIIVSIWIVGPDRIFSRGDSASPTATPNSPPGPPKVESASNPGTFDKSALEAEVSALKNQVATLRGQIDDLYEMTVQLKSKVSTGSPFLRENPAGITDFTPYFKGIAKWRNEYTYVPFYEDLILSLINVRTLDGLALTFFDKPIHGFNNLTAWYVGYSQGNWEPQTFTVYRRFIKPDDVVLDFGAWIGDDVVLDFGAWIGETPGTLSYRRFIIPDNVVLDIGAWIGVTALYAGRLTKNVYAMEPDPAAYEYLAANLYANHDLHERVQLDHTCIWIESDTTLDFYLPNDVGSGSGSSLMHGMGAKISVKCTTLKDWAWKNGVKKIDFIKMDTEGAELLLIPSVVPFLKSLPAIPNMWLSVHPPFWKDAATKKEPFAAALKSLYRACYLEATQTAINFDNITPFLDGCGFCTVMCTNMPHDKIAWHIDLARTANETRVFNREKSAVHFF